jgi:hypothetical protein
LKDERENEEKGRGMRKRTTRWGRSIQSEKEKEGGRETSQRHTPPVLSFLDPPLDVVGKPNAAAPLPLLFPLLAPVPVRLDALLAAILTGAGVVDPAPPPLSLPEPPKGAAEGRVERRREAPPRAWEGRCLRGDLEGGAAAAEAAMEAPPTRPGLRRGIGFEEEMDMLPAPAEEAKEESPAL